MISWDRTSAHPPTDACRRLPGAAALPCLVVAWSAGATLPAHAESAPTPSLSITVDNGTSTVKPGEQLDYTITVTNLGADPVKGLRLSQTVPEGASLVSSGSGGTLKSGTVRWTVDVAATRKATVRSTLKMSDPAPAGLNRLATVACAATAANGAPLVCATDSDLLPEGAAAEQRQAAPAGPAVTQRPWWPYAGGGALLVGAAVGGLALLRRRRRAAAPVSRRAQPSDVR